MKKILVLLMLSLFLIFSACVNEQETTDSTYSDISESVESGDLSSEPDTSIDEKSEESATQEESIIKEESGTQTDEHPNLYNQLHQRDDSNYYDVVNYVYNGTAVNEAARGYYPKSYGLADENQVIFIPCEYRRKITVISDNRFCADNNEGYFLLNKEHEVIYRADSIFFGNNPEYGIARFWNGDEQTIYYLIDTDGKIVDDSWDFVESRDDGFYATKSEKLFELDNKGKVIKEVDTSPKIIDSTHDKIDLVYQEHPLDLYGFFGALDKKGNVIVPIEYNGGVQIICDNCIFASFCYGTVDSTGTDMYDFSGNKLCEGYSSIDFYNKDGVFYEYGIADKGFYDSSNNIKYNSYLINRKGEVICEISYYSVSFEDEDTLCVQDSENSEEYLVNIADLIE